MKIKQFLRPSRDLIGVGCWLLRIMGILWVAGLELMILVGLYHIIFSPPSLYPPRLLRIGMIPAIVFLCAAGGLVAVLLPLWLRFVRWIKAKQLAVCGYTDENPASEK